MHKIAPTTMNKLQESCDEAFLTKLLGFLQQRFDPRIHREFVETTVSRGRECGISSEQDLATLSTVLWAAQKEGDRLWVNSILTDSQTSGADKIERLKAALRARLPS
jgi:hypothetical protein